RLDGRVQERSPQGEDEAARDEHRPRSAEVGDAAGDDGDRDHDQRSWRDREARLEERVCPPLRKEEDEVEEHGGERDGKCERRHVREAVRGIRKQAQIHGGRRCCPGPKDETHKQQSSSSQAGEGARTGEPPARSLDDGEREQRHAGDEQDDAERIGQLARRLVARLEEAALKSARPRRKVRLRPTRSAMRPDGTSRAPNTIVYALRTQESWAAETRANVARIAGKATKRTVPSRETTNTATLVRASVRQA